MVAVWGMAGKRGVGKVGCGGPVQPRGWTTPDPARHTQFRAHPEAHSHTRQPLRTYPPTGEHNSTNVPSGHRTYATVCPHGFWTGPFNDAAPAATARS